MGEQLQGTLDVLRSNEKASAVGLRMHLKIKGCGLRGYTGFGVLGVFDEDPSDDKTRYPFLNLKPQSLDPQSSQVPSTSLEAFEPLNPPLAQVPAQVCSCALRMLGLGFASHEIDSHYLRPLGHALLFQPYPLPLLVRKGKNLLCMGEILHHRGLGFTVYRPYTPIATAVGPSKALSPNSLSP